MADNDFIAHETGATGSAFGSDAATEARDFCLTWERAVKTIGLYPPTNPLPSEFREKFFNTLTGLIDILGRLVFSVTDTRLGFLDSTVYDKDPTDESLAFMLFRDGICQIAFEPGLTRDESDRFLNVMADVLSSPNSRVDIANRLWYEAFDHIRHYTLDRIVEGTYLEMANDTDLHAPHLDFIELEEGQIETAPAVEAPPAYEGMQKERMEYVVKVFGDVTRLSPEEHEEIVTIARPESATVSEQLGVEILFEILRTGESPRLIEETIALTEKQFREQVAANRWDLIRFILENWHGTVPVVPASVQRQLKATLVRAADTKNFESLADWLNDNPQADLDDVRALLEHFGTFAISPITAMLGVLNHRPSRMMVCSFLAEHGRDAIDLIGGFIYDKRWFVVRNVAKILGEIGKERGLAFLKKSAQHDDRRVRVETLRALGKINTPPARLALLDFLRDKEKEVRMRALRTIGNGGVHEAHETLADLAGSEALFNVDPDEMREILQAYAQVGGDAAVAQLEKLAGHSPWLGRRRWVPINQAALRALSLSMSQHAYEVLGKLAQSSDQEIRDVARAAEARWLRNQIDGGPKSGDEIDDEDDDTEESGDD